MVKYKKAVMGSPSLKNMRKKWAFNDVPFFSGYIELAPLKKEEPHSFAEEMMERYAPVLEKLSKT